MDLEGFKLFKCWLLSKLPIGVGDGRYLREYRKVLGESYQKSIETYDRKFKDLAYKRFKESKNHDTSPKILFDVETTRLFKNSLTGIQRVVWSVLSVLLRQGVPGYKVYPVYMTQYGLMKANRFLHENFPEFSGDVPAEDEYFQVTGQDIYLSLDLTLGLGTNRKFQAYFDELKRTGVSIYFFLHDIIPIRRHQDSDPEHLKTFEQYVRFISRFDGVIGNSKATADDYRDWLRDNMPDVAGTLPVTWTHLGHDLQKYSFSRGLPASSKTLFDAMKARETCLMVSTVDPRKGYREAFAAFEELWARGRDCNLVIVGRPGWNMADFFGYLNNHVENGKRFFWLQGINDEYLHEVYERTTGVLMASKAEGFGLAVIECAGHGKPLLCRNLPVFEEIAGEHATYFSDDEPKPLADAIEAWLDAISKGQAPDSGKIKALTWEDMTDNLLEIILPKPGADK